MPAADREGSLSRIRAEAAVLRERADWQTFALLAGAAIGVTTLFALVLVVRSPRSIFLWPIVAGFVLSAAAVLWTRRTRRVDTGLAVLATAMLVGIAGVIFVQRGSHAPALVYGVTTVAVVFIAGRQKLAVRLAVGLLAWTAAVTWAARRGLVGVDAANPLGLDTARLLAAGVALVLIGAASHIVYRRRRGMEEVLQRALRLTEDERDHARRLAERRARTVAEISHEIRTPMTGIVGVAQLLAHDADSPARRQLLSLHRNSAERLLHLVNDVLAQAKLESLPAAVQAQPYAPQSVVADVTSLFAPQAHRRDVEIGWWAEPDVPARIVGDEMRVRQVLSNLVSNAVKFTDRGAVQVRLLRPTEALLRFEVHDTGRGVPPGRSEAIFEPYVSGADEGEAAFSTGLGLPISRDLARRMGGDIGVTSVPGVGSRFDFDVPCIPAEPAQTQAGTGSGGGAGERPAPGRLWVIGASAPLERQLRHLLRGTAVDTEFLDRVPGDDEWAARPGAQALLVDAWAGHGRCAAQLSQILRDAAAKQRRVVVVSSVAQDAAFGTLANAWHVFRPLGSESLFEALTWAFGDARAPVPEAGPAPAPRLRTLLVDDNPVNRIIGRTMLEELGSEVVVADSGTEALDEFSRHRFDLVLMDVQMPGLDGAEAAQRLRIYERASGLRRARVVAVTGLSVPDLEALHPGHEFDAVLSKPYTVGQLRDIVEGRGQREPRVPSPEQA